MKPEDERAHQSLQPAASNAGWETWHLDAASSDGIGLSVRLACAPERGLAWWWTYLVLPDLPGPVVVRDHEVPPPRRGLEIRTDGLWGELTCETPFEHWTYGLEAFGVRLDEPADALRGEIGERMPVGLDIEWEVESDAGELHERTGDGPGRGYSQIGVVHGEVLLGRSRIELDAIGRRSHTWGTAGSEDAVASAWFRAGDLEVDFATFVDGRADGYRVSSGAPALEIASVRRETVRDADRLPVAARDVIDHELEVEVEVLGMAPVPLDLPGGGRMVLSRALCRFDAGVAPDTGALRTGNGWASWLDPE